MFRVCDAGNPNRLYQMPSLGESKSFVSTSIRCVRAIALTRQFLVVNLILLCNDISTNPGPVANGQMLFLPKKYQAKSSMLTVFDMSHEFSSKMSR